MPARAEFYNQLVRIGGCERPEFQLLAQVNADEPPQLQARVFRDTEGAHLVDRMLAYRLALSFC